MHSPGVGYSTSRYSTVLSKSGAVTARSLGPQEKPQSLLTHSPGKKVPGRIHCSLSRLRRCGSMTDFSPAPTAPEPQTSPSVQEVLQAQRGITTEPIPINISVETTVLCLRLNTERWPVIRCLLGAALVPCAKLAR